jgi:putative SOS response-associated peptidase YedK
MCGRYASFLPAEALARLFGTSGPLPNLEPTWNMALTKDAPIVRFDPEIGERRLEVAKWGLVPFFTNGLGEGPQADQRAVRDGCPLAAVQGSLRATPLSRAGCGLLRVAA